MGSKLQGKINPPGTKLHFVPSPFYKGGQELEHNWQEK
jgi:hypothetical protein